MPDPARAVWRAILADPASCLLVLDAEFVARSAVYTRRAIEAALARLG